MLLVVVTLDGSVRMTASEGVAGPEDVGESGEGRLILERHVLGDDHVRAPLLLVGQLRLRRVERGPLSLRWHLRWGALLIAGFGLWLRLQSLRGAGLGIAVDVATGAAVLLLASLARAPAVPTATRSQTA